MEKWRMYVVLKQQIICVQNVNFYRRRNQLFR